MTMDHGTVRTTVDDGEAAELQGRPAVRVAVPGAPATALLPSLIDEDELEAADSFDLPGADLSSEEISVQILAAQADEFTCASCFLVRHRSQIAHDRGGLLYCVDCEG
ncbi:DUF4193 domain-containing protein [Arthrobacter sp. B0490]|uniref:DUF4193 domain-containing protein n=1 Tax=Arthrobacter sp. B0490 TaxID=2058891 RepID=UPI000CE45FA0|nr:DUF4193 domain-containing protein [Arthrobacter sp. B0490]